MPTIAKGSTAIKVACLECIRGHRSSQCVHVNKVLIEVRKPGRPLNAIPASANGHDGATASNLQPAYVVSGHSRCECPTTGIIPESDWKQTDSQPYPKGKNSDQAFRVSKSSTKSRTPRLSISRRTSYLQQEGDMQDQTNASPIQRSSDPPAKPSCCSNKVRRTEEGSISQHPSGQHNIMNHSQQDRQIEKQDPKLPIDLNGQHNTLDGFSGEPFKVIYDTQYNNMSDSQFRLFIDSLSPAEMVEIFPWRSNPRPLPSSQQATQEQNITDSQAAPSVREISNIGQLVLNHDNDTAPDDCTCGDDCACLGCALHPANATTMDHVREATEFMQNDPHYTDGSALMTFEHVAAVLQARQDSRLTNFPRPDSDFVASKHQGTAAHEAYDPLLKNFGPLGDNGQAASIMNSSSLMGNLSPLPDKIHAAQRFEPQNALLYTGFGHQQQAFAIHPFSGSGQVFVMSQHQRPSCVDDHGYCQCGPDCSCSGCQVHSTSHLEHTFPLSMPPQMGSSEGNVSDSFPNELLSKLQDSTAFPSPTTTPSVMTSSEIAPTLTSPPKSNEEHRHRFDTETGYAPTVADDMPASWAASPVGSLFTSPHQAFH